MGKHVLIVAALGVLALAVGCEKRSTLYCMKTPDDYANCERPDAPPAPPPVACSMTQPCSDGYCEPIAKVCVECLLDEHCPMGEHCDQTAFACKGCVEHADCAASDVCLPSGSCGNDASVIYVDAGGTDNANCTVGEKCKTIAHAVTLLTESRSYLRVTGELQESPRIEVDVEIIGDGGRLLGDGMGKDYVIEVAGAIVKVYGLAVYCSGAGDQSGFRVGGKSTLTMSRVDVSNCGRDAGIKLTDSYLELTRSSIHHNPIGGIKIDDKSSFVITNNFIYRNGSATSMFGGIEIAGDPRIDSLFEFNTVVNNAAGLTKGGGADCARAIPMRNNIFALTTLPATDIVVCDAADSLVTSDEAGLQFTSVADDNYHIGPTSIAKDLAPDGSAVNDDFDGHFRPLDAGKDYGADEYRAP